MAGLQLPCILLAFSAAAPATASLALARGGGQQADAAAGLAGGLAEASADAAEDADASFGAFILKAPPLLTTAAGHMFGISDNLRPIDDILKIMRDMALVVRATAAGQLHQAESAGSKAADAIDRVRAKSQLRMSGTLSQATSAAAVGWNLKRLVAKLRSPPEEALLPSHSTRMQVDMELNNTLTRLLQARTELVDNFANAFRAVKDLNRVTERGEGRYCRAQLAPDVGEGSEPNGPRKAVGEAVKNMVSSAAQQAVPPSVMEHARNLSATFTQKAGEARAAATQLLLRATQSSGLHNISQEDVQATIKAAGEQMGMEKQAKWLGTVIHDGWDECSRAQAFVADANKSVDVVASLVAAAGKQAEKILHEDVRDARTGTTQRLTGLISKVTSSSPELPSAVSSQVLAAGSLVMAPTAAEAASLQAGFSKALAKLNEAQARVTALRRAAADLSRWSDAATTSASDSAAEQKRRQGLRLHAIPPRVLHDFRRRAHRTGKALAELASTALEKPATW